ALSTTDALSTANALCTADTASTDTTDTTDTTGTSLSCTAGNGGNCWEHDSLVDCLDQCPGKVGSKCISQWYDHQIIDRHGHLGVNMFDHPCNTGHVRRGCL